jgi:hypothetical protein
MGRQSGKTLSFSEYIGAWAIFGTRMIDHHEQGYTPTDLHEGNLLLSKDTNDVVNVDLGGIVPVNYPRDWQMLPLVLLSLLSWLDPERTAAFRFGYISQGGPIAKMVFDFLRTEYEFNGFQQSAHLEFHPRQNQYPQSGDLTAMDEEWRKLRGTLPVGNQVHRIFSLDDLSEWRRTRDEQRLESPSVLDEFFYRRHLISAHFHASGRGVLEAVLNLAGYYEVAGNIFAAVSLLRYARNFVKEFEKHMAAPLRTRVIDWHLHLHSLLDSDAKHQLDLIPDFANIFHIIWCIEDCQEGLVIYNNP